MTRVTVTWTKTSLSKIAAENDTKLYAFSRGKQLIYIGLAYHQDVKVEVKQTLKRLNINSTGLSIWLGDISSSTLQRISKQLVYSVECLLIYRNQPLENSQCIQNYKGRNDLTVTSKDCPRLKGQIKTPKNF